MKLKNNIGESFINDKKYDSLKASCQAIAAGLCQTIILFLLVILFSWSVCYSQTVSSKNHKTE